MENSHNGPFDDR